MSPTIPTFALVSSSPRVSFATLQLIAKALDAQMREDLAPAYDADPWPVVAYADKASVPAGSIAFEFTEVLDDPNAIAYHTEDASGVRWGVCGIAVVLDNGGTLTDGSNSLAAAASHELCETYADANVSTYVAMNAQGLLSYETSDPTESDAYAKTVTNDDGTTTSVSVSNFCWPAYFDPQTPAGTQLDQMNLCTAPGELRPGGYQVWLSAAIDKASGQATLVVTNTYGHGYPEHKKAAKLAKGSRSSARAAHAVKNGARDHRALALAPTERP